MDPAEQSRLAWAAAALFGPLAMALVLAIAPPIRRQGRLAAWLSVATASGAFGAALVVFVTQQGEPALVQTGTWLAARGESLVEVGLCLDGVSAAMLVIVTFVSSMVQVFSLGYMANEPLPAQGRYFAYHSLFVFSMNLLVLAPNLLQFFVGWELVGLTSYLLIGFYYQKPSAGHAAVKAFWVTKFADMGLLLGLVVMLVATNSVAFDTPLNGGLATAVTLLLFGAVMGKSAQFPLHIWLPNAMEGPTPVSALLHAATMVAAGVYLLVRANPLFTQAPLTQEVVLWVGSFTAVFAAAVAIVQSDIKRVLAYSTCSQLGFMVAASGANAVFAGYLHLVTHAFFKALLFLAAGSAIHAVHSNELEDMGGLARRMPVTAVSLGVGALALAGVPGFSGFFSKELILEGVAERRAWVPLAALMAATGLTAFYVGKMVLLALFGAASERARKAHESGVSMTFPLVMLAVPALGAGYFASDFAGTLGVEYHFELGLVGVGASALGLVGLGLSYAVFGVRSWAPARVPALVALRSLARSGLVDRGFTGLFYGVVLRLAGAVGWVDRYLVDGAINGCGWAALVVSRRLQRLQTGNVLDYVFAVAAAAGALTVWGLFP